MIEGWALIAPYQTTPRVPILCSLSHRSLVDVGRVLLVPSPAKTSLEHGKCIVRMWLVIDQSLTIIVASSMLLLSSERDKVPVTSKMNETAHRTVRIFLQLQRIVEPPSDCEESSRNLGRYARKLENTMFRVICCHFRIKNIIPNLIEMITWRHMLYWDCQAFSWQIRHSGVLFLSINSLFYGFSLLLTKLYRSYKVFIKFLIDRQVLCCPSLCTQLYQTF